MAIISMIIKSRKHKILVITMAKKKMMMMMMVVSTIKMRNKTERYIIMANSSSNSRNKLINLRT